MSEQELNEQAQDFEELEESQEDESDNDSPNFQELYEQERLKNKKLKRKLFTKEKEPEEKSKLTNRPDALWQLKMELKVDGYNDEEASFIIKNGGKKALESQYIVSAIEAMREKRSAESAMIDSSTKSESEKRFSPEEFSKLSAEEQLKVLHTSK